MASVSLCASSGEDTRVTVLDPMASSRTSATTVLVSVSRLSGAPPVTNYIDPVSCLDGSGLQVIRGQLNRLHSHRNFVPRVSPLGAPG